LKYKIIILIVGGLFIIFAGYSYFDSLTVPEHIHSRDDGPQNRPDQSQNMLENVNKLEARVQNNPDDFVLIMNLGHAYLGTKQYAKGVEIFKKASQMRPQNPESHVDLGIALRETGKTEDAIDLFEKVIRNNPQYGEAWLQAAIVYRYNIKDNLKALNYFKKFLLIEPDSETAPRVKQEIERIETEMNN
jgi:tetratricopeptide (TPR) repeat protein